MVFRKFALACLLAAGVSWLPLSGCATGERIKLPEARPEKIRVYQQVSVWANRSAAKGTGVYLKKGELFSLLITGKVNTSPRRYPRRWESHYARLGMMLDDQYYGFTPSNRTTVSDHSGEIRFYVKDGGFDHRRGKALHPEWYQNNLGRFDVTIIVWAQKDWAYVSAYFKQVMALNPDSNTARVASSHAERYRDYYIAEMETVKAVAETQKRIESLKQSSPPVSEDKRIDSLKPLLPPGPDDAVQSAWGATQAHAGLPADTAKSTTKDNEIAILEARLADLMAKLDRLEEIKQELAAEREKTARLSEELQASTRQGGEQADQSPPLLLIASPRDGQKTPESSVRLTGVVEDNRGLQTVEVYINDRLIPPDKTRGLTITPAEAIKRREFNAKLPLEKGINRIRIRATDINGRVAEKAFVVTREARRHQTWAVIIGIDSYPRIPKLKYAVNDARAFYRLLVQNNRIPAENVVLMTDGEATLTRLRSSLGTRLKQSAGRDDMVIIYFAGHGATERDAMSPDGDGLEKYILPHDADPKDLYATALPMREISHILNRIQSERLIFIADACYSGASGGRTISIGGFRANISDGYLNRIARGKGRVIITASGANEVSAENDSLQHGVFTYYLIEGLKGRADFDRDGLVTVDEVYRFVSDTVPKATAQEQHPVKKGAVEGQLVLGVVD